MAMNWKREWKEQRDKKGSFCILVRESSGWQSSQMLTSSSKMIGILVSNS